jgi:hypothetical protein
MMGPRNDPIFRIITSIIARAKMLVSDVDLDSARQERNISALLIADTSLKYHVNL